MANFATKIVLIGAIQSVIADLLPNHVVVGDDSTVIVNPNDAVETVQLDVWNDETLLALAHMSDDADGVAGEYFTKLGGDTKNFTAQMIYKAVKPITQSHSLVGNDGKNHRPTGADTGAVYFRKSTASEILKRLNSTQSTTEKPQFTIVGQADEVNVLARLAGVAVIGEVGAYMAPSPQGLVAVDSVAERNFELLGDWDSALQAVKDYVPVNTLPVINGFEGAIEGDFVVYSCAKIPKVYFQVIEGATRRIKSLELTSEVVINADDFEAIAKVVNA